MTEEVLQETGENLRDMETFELDFVRIRISLVITCWNKVEVYFRKRKELIKYINNNINKYENANMIRSNFLIWFNRNFMIEHLLTILCPHWVMVSFFVILTRCFIWLENVPDNSYLFFLYPSCFRYVLGTAQCILMTLNILPTLRW